MTVSIVQVMTTVSHSGVCSQLKEVGYPTNNYEMPYSVHVIVKQTYVDTHLQTTHQILCSSEVPHQ